MAYILIFKLVEKDLSNEILCLFQPMCHEAGRMNVTTPKDQLVKHIKQMPNEHALDCEIFVFV